MAGVLYLCEKSNANAMRSSVNYAPHCDDFVGRAFGGRSSPSESFSLMSFWLGRDSDPDYSYEEIKNFGTLYACNLEHGGGFAFRDSAWEKPADTWRSSPSESFTLYSSWVGSALLEKMNAASIFAPISNLYAYLEQD